MYPPTFDYRAPDSLEEALDAVAEVGDDGRVLAGGQSLIPLMKLRLAFPEVLIDLGRVPDLDHIVEDAVALRIGAMTRHSALASSDVLAARYPAMAAAAPQIADPLVRNLGTIGGSLAHADPAGDWGSVLLALRGQVVARSRSGERTVPARELFAGQYTTTLEPGEVITEVRVLRPSRPTGGTYLKLERKVGDFATVGVAVHVEMDDGRIAQAGIGLTAVGPQNIAATAAEDALAGAEPSTDAFEEAARLAAEASDPHTDVRGSAAYKRAVVAEYVRRGLTAAVSQAQGS